jgi:uncharacterized membrane protein
MTSMQGSHSTPNPRPAPILAPPEDGATEAPLRLGRFPIVVAALMFIAGLLVYPHLPERIPMHWNMQGGIDRWGEHSIPNVFFQPLLVVALALLAWALPRIDPLRRSYGRFRSSYYLIIDIIAAMLALLYAVTLYASFNTTVPVGVVVPVSVGLLMALIGNQLAKVKRNFFVGFRTPWTLASDVVWTRTHRIGARVFMFAGLGAALAAFLPPPYNFVVFMVIVLGASAAVLAISYVIYRHIDQRPQSTGRSGEGSPHTPVP